MYVRCTCSLDVKCTLLFRSKILLIVVLKVAPKVISGGSQGQTQRILLPATSQGLSQITPSLNQGTLSQLPPGTTFIQSNQAVQGVQGYALVPAQYITQVNLRMKMKLYYALLTEVLHEVKNLHALAKRPFQLIKWTDVKYPNGKWYHRHTHSPRTYARRP